MTIKWGDPIECNGVRPEWLRDGEEIQFENTSDDWLNGPAGRYTWDVRDECPISIKLPADHFAYTAIRAGFTPWAGGDSAPDDWDGGAVLLRGRAQCPGALVTDWRDHEDLGGAKIIGYRKRTDGNCSGADTVTLTRMTRGEALELWRKESTVALAATSTVADRVVLLLRGLGLVRQDETPEERFTRETGHEVTDAVRAALNWKDA